MAHTGRGGLRVCTDTLCRTRRSEREQHTGQPAQTLVGETLVGETTHRIVQHSQQARDGGIVSGALLEHRACLLSAGDGPSHHCLHRWPPSRAVVPLGPCARPRRCSYNREGCQGLGLKTVAKVIWIFDRPSRVCPSPVNATPCLFSCSTSQDERLPPVRGLGCM
jgi:hypothetical protein